MAAPRYFPDSEDQSYYLSKQIKKFIFEINDLLDIDAEVREQVQQLLQLLLEFIKVSDPRKFSEDQSQNKLNSLVLLARNLQDQYLIVDSAWRFVDEAVNYVMTSADLRIDDLRKKNIAHLKPPIETEIEQTKPMPITEEQWITANDPNTSFISPKQLQQLQELRAEPTSGSDYYDTKQPTLNNSNTATQSLATALTDHQKILQKELLKYEAAEIFDVGDQIELGSIVGQGNFGFVFMGIVANPNPEFDEELNSRGLKHQVDRQVIVKLLKVETDETILLLKREGAIGDKIRNAALKGENGSQYVAMNSLAVMSIEGTDRLVIISKHESQGSLKDYLVKQYEKNLSSTNKINLLGRIFDQQREGLAFLHRNNIIHRDFALRNLLIDADGKIKICDFGLAQEIGTEPNAKVMHDGKGPTMWMDDQAKLFTSDQDTDVFGMKITMLEEFATIVSGDPQKLWSQILHILEVETALGSEKANEGLKAFRGLDQNAYLSKLSNVLQSIIEGPEVSAADRKKYLEFYLGVCQEFNIPPPSSRYAYVNTEPPHQKNINQTDNSLAHLLALDSDGEVAQTPTQSKTIATPQDISSSARINVKMQNNPPNPPLMPETTKPQSKVESRNIHPTLEKSQARSSQDTQLNSNSKAKKGDELTFEEKLAHFRSLERQNLSASSRKPEDLSKEISTTPKPFRSRS